MLMRIKSLLKRFNHFSEDYYIRCQIALWYLSSSVTWAAGNNTVTHFVNNVRDTFTLIKDLMIIVAFVCGMGFMMIGLFKFKAYKDNPAQIPLSTPIALIAVSTGLLFLPTVFELAGSALFGEAAQPGLPLSKTLNF